MFSVRIVTVDHYQGPPLHGLDPQYSTFRGAPVKRAPVIRVFGVTPAGQKACVHIHGAFPYLLVPYDGTEPLASLPHALATALDRAINTASGHAASPTQHVYKITPVSGIPFYGYHSQEHQFLKIFLYNPTMVKKAAELLQNGVVRGKVYQPHEAHVPYQLQFLMDHNLHGMNLIHLSSCKFRRPAGMEDVEGGPSSPSPGPSGLSSTVSDGAGVGGAGAVRASMKVWTRDTIPADMWLPAEVERTTTCDLEVDALFSDILNRLQLGGGTATNPGLAYIWEDEVERMRGLGEVGITAGDLKPPGSPPRTNVQPSDSEVFYRAQLKEKLEAWIEREAEEGRVESDGASEAASQGVSLAAVTPEDADLIPATAITANVAPDLSTIQDATGTEHDETTVAAMDDSEVNEALILSLTQQSQSQWMDSCDVELLEVMAGLADGSQPTEPEDHDAILSSQAPRSVGRTPSQPDGKQVEGEKDGEDEEEDEEAEMTQRIWDTILTAQVEGEEEKKRIPGSKECAVG